MQCASAASCAPQALVEKLQAESRDSASAVTAVTARWAQLMDVEVPQALQEALQAQQAECEVVVGRKGVIIEAARNILTAQDDEFVSTLKAQAEVSTGERAPLVNKANRLALASFLPLCRTWMLCWSA